MLSRNATPDRRFRFAAVISHPTQHHAPVFRELARRPEFQVKVFYACDWGVTHHHDPGFNHSFSWNVDLLSGYDYEFLPTARRPRNMGFWEIDSPGVDRSLAAFQPHAVWLHGYGHRVCWRAASWARKRAARIHFGDSELIHERPFWRRALKSIFLRRYFRGCDAFITIGDNNEAYYQHYGVTRDRLFRGVYPIDIARFRKAIQDTDRPSRSEIRKQYGFPDFDFIALWVGKLEPRKRPDDFLLAIAELARNGAQIGGLIIGDGPQNLEVKRRIHDLDLTNRVRMMGFVNQAELPLILDAGDLLVTTSAMDPHPLVVTEGMAVGLPVIASDRVGCVGPTDTARPGVNCLVYSCGEVRGLADCLGQLAADSKLRRRFGEASYEIASSQGPLNTVYAVLESLLHVHERGQYDWSEISQSAWDRMRADVNPRHLSYR